MNKIVAYRFLTNDFYKIIEIDNKAKTVELDDGDIVDFDDVMIFEIYDYLDLKL